MKAPSWIAPLFVVAGVYDAGLAIVFLFAGPPLFDALEIARPNHWGYIHFPALILVLFGFMFFQVARDPVANRGLVPYGIGLKVCYFGTVFGHLFFSSIPLIWIIFAVADVVFALLFVVAFLQLRQRYTTVKPSRPAAIRASSAV